MIKFFLKILKKYYEFEEMITDKQVSKLMSNFEENLIKKEKDNIK